MTREYDLRQLDKMYNQISNYEQGDINIDSLINDLIFLRDVISYCPDGWEKKFTDNLINLESVNSYIIEHDIKDLDSNLIDIIKTSISSLKKLISELKNEL